MTTRRAQMAIEADSGNTDDFLTPRERLAEAMKSYAVEVATFKRKNPTGLEREHLEDSLYSAERQIMKMLFLAQGEHAMDVYDGVGRELYDG